MSVFRLIPLSLLVSTDHSNRVNKAIHLLCIWPIVWTGCALMTQCSCGKLPPTILEQLPLKDEAWNLHLGTPVVLLYIFFYLGEGERQPDPSVAVWTNRVSCGSCF